MSHPAAALKVMPCLDSARFSTPWPPYTPGKAVAAPDGRSYKLSSNESPYDPLPSVVEAIAEGARNIHRYPDAGAVKLTEAVAERFGVPEAHVALGGRGP
ncbi:hypothetical protein GCM10020001_048790 [Nonomuraea salmonea]